MSHIHIPDGVLPVWLWVCGWLLTLAIVFVAGRLAERTDVRRKVPLLAVVSALMLVSMSSEIVPLAYHVNLTVIAGVLLGPVLAVIAAFIVEVVLAMLGHGGVTVLGLNTLMIAAEMVLGWALFRALIVVLTRRRVRAAAVVATVLTLATTTTLLVGLVALAGGSTAAAMGEQPTMNLARFAAMVYTLGPLGWLLESLITAWVLGYVARVRPGLLWDGALAHQERHVLGDEGVQ